MNGRRMRSKGRGWSAMHRSMYWFPPGKGNRREINVKQRKDGVQCIEACHRGWKRWSSLLAEMTRRPEPVGENRSRSSRSRSRDLCTTLNFKENGSSRDVETKQLPAVPVFFGYIWEIWYMYEGLSGCIQSMQPQCETLGESYAAYCILKMQGNYMLQTCIASIF